MTVFLQSVGKVPTGIYTFRAQNYYGMKNQQDIVVKPEIANAIPENAEEIIDAIPELKSGDEN